MHLNLPVLDQLSACKNLLIAGMGGGYDIFCGLPIYFELRERGQTVHLANYSFSGISGLQPGGTERLTHDLVGVTANYERNVLSYFPELHLAKWFQEKRGEEIVIWCFQKTGARPLIVNYHTLIEHLSIDGILLIDGGIDSLARGDENEVGTIAEDALSLLAVNEMNHVPLRMIACLGFGAEESITHAHILENMAELTQADAFLGSCALLKQMPAYQAYEEATLFVHDSPHQSPSVINASVISAVRGHYGNFHLTGKTQGSQLWISPLMSQYWFFDLPPVAERNLLIPDLGWTETFLQAWNTILELRQTIRVRKNAKIPL